MSKPSVVVVDYGMGNLRSAQKGLEKAGVNAAITSDPAAVSDADGVVLPGVGAFRDCMANLTQAKLIDPVLEAVHEGKPFLGICLGMQLLLTVSEEFGMHKGMDLVPGKVIRFPHDLGLKVPHMGWNKVFYNQGQPGRLFDGIPEGSFFYFVHSYIAAPDDISAVSGFTDYGLQFCSAISSGNIFATQFHPEKSAPWGLNVLENFGKIVAEKEK